MSDLTHNDGHYYSYDGTEYWFSNGIWYYPNHEGVLIPVSVVSDAAPTASNMERRRQHQGRLGLEPRYASPSSTSANFGSSNSTIPASPTPNEDEESFMGSRQSRHGHRQSSRNWAMQQYLDEAAGPAEVQMTMGMADRHFPRTDLVDQQEYYASHLDFSDTAGQEGSNEHHEGPPRRSRDRPPAASQSRSNLESGNSGTRSGRSASGSTSKKSKRKR
ncbi:hypothetical protein BGZ63DRAFT_38731 [Mariannaea sp. PMI_226]|nr:hypothetical protein BGZ63DRAFT_38731 [Mariannaea sp. PMI_226]